MHSTLPSVCVVCVCVECVCERDEVVEGEFWWWGGGGGGNFRDSRSLAVHFVQDEMLPHCCPIVLGSVATTPKKTGVAEKTSETENSWTRRVLTGAAFSLSQKLFSGGCALGLQR